MRRAKRKFLTFTTYEDADPKAFTEMEWFKKCSELTSGADLFEAVHSLFGEELADWVWHYALDHAEAAKKHDDALDAVMA